MVQLFCKTLFATNIRHLKIMKSQIYYASKLSRINETHNNCPQRRYLEYNEYN